MTQPPKPLLSVEEIERFVALGLETIERLKRDHDAGRIRRYKSARVAPGRLLQLAAAATAMHDEPRLLDLVAKALPEALWFKDYDTIAGPALDAITELVRVVDARRVDDPGGGPDRRVRALAAHPKPVVRAAVAKGLSPATPAGLALLQALAVDADAAVRAAAKKAMGDANAPPWWSALFDAEPTARLPERDRERAEIAVRRVLELANEPYPTGAQQQELGQELAHLPTPLVLEAARRLLDVDGFGALMARTSTLRCALGRPGAAAFLLTLLPRFEERMIGLHLTHVVPDLLGGLAPDVRRALGDELRAGALAAPAEQAREAWSWPRLAIKLSILALPPGADPTPFLDAAVERAAEEVLNGPRAAGTVVDDLLEIFQREDLDVAAAAGRVEEAFFAPSSALWSSRLRPAAVAHLPRDRRRLLAQRLLGGDDSRVAWALAQLLGAARDPDLDGPRLPLVERFAADPRIERLLPAHVNIAGRRRLLRGGRATFEQAAIAMTDIDEVWGGIREPSRGDDAQAKRRKQLADVLGPRSLHGPVTAEEWTLYRAARDRAELEPHGVGLALPVIPAGPRSPSDDAVVRRALEVATSDSPFLLDLVVAIQVSAIPGDLELLERVAAVDDYDRLRYFVDKAREHAAKTLGLPAPAPLPSRRDDDL